jgi:hypothetical protein
MTTTPGSDAVAWLLNVTAGGPHAESTRKLLLAPTDSVDAASRPDVVVVAPPAAAFRFHELVIRSAYSGKALC